MDAVPTGRSWWYHVGVATNLRLSADLVLALREEARRSGRSQQDIVRHALRRELGLVPGESELELAIRRGIVAAPTPFQDVEPSSVLADGTTTADLLDREDR